jgi:replicative DNA helicase
MSHVTSEVIDNRLPLSHIQAEQNLLGALIAGAAVLADLPPGFQSAWFSDPVHGAIFRAIAFRTETGQPLDRVGMAHEAEDSDVLDDLGGASYFPQLVEVPAAASEPVDIAYLSSVLAPCSEEAGGVVPGAVLEEVGGAAYLLELAQRPLRPIVVCARTIRDAWLRRELIDLGQSITDLAFKGYGAEALQMATQKVAHLTVATR